LDKQKRKVVIAGNWKMNKTADETKAVIKEMIPLVSDADCSVILCVPFINVTSALEAAKGTNIKIGVQNMHFEDKGAFTGEISANMLKAFGIEYAISATAKEDSILTKPM